MGHRLFILRASHRGGTAWPGRASLRVAFKNIEVALSLSSVNRQEGRCQPVLLLTAFTPRSLSFRVGVIRVSADQGIAGEIRWTVIGSIAGAGLSRSCSAPGALSGRTITEVGACCQATVTAWGRSQPTGQD